MKITKKLKLWAAFLPLWACASITFSDTEKHDYQSEYKRASSIILDKQWRTIAEQHEYRVGNEVSPSLIVNALKALTPASMAYINACNEHQEILALTDGIKEEMNPNWCKDEMFKAAQGVIIDHVSKLITGSKK